MIKNVQIIDNNNKYTINPTTYQYASLLPAKTGRPYMFYRVNEITNETQYDIYLYPTADKNYEIEIYGSIYDVSIENENSETFWSKNYPELLIDATKLAIEYNLHRNYETSAMYREMLMNSITNLYYKLCQEELSGTDIYEKDGYPKTE
jgi:hypothetical protein